MDKKNDEDGRSLLNKNVEFFSVLKLKQTNKQKNS